MRRLSCCWAVGAICGASIVGSSGGLHGAEQEEGTRAETPVRPRARELGICVGVLTPGVNNAMTDVPGVLVGHCTVWEGEDVRTGVTAILPHGGNVFQEKVPAAIVVGNGFGKLVGISQVEELGNLETPVVLTTTLSVFTAADAVIDHTLQQEGNEDVVSINPVVGETNDGFLNDIRGRHVHREHVLAAIGAARSGAVEEGGVGAGTGTRCFGFKGGIGTASRKLPEAAGAFTVGVLVQTNFGGVLTVDGAPVGEELGQYYLRELVETREPEHGSCMIVVATDAPLDARSLKRLARRALFGLAATGSSMSHGSGDYAIAFSTAEGLRVPYSGGPRERQETVLDDRALSPLFQAVREATEEAILNSLFRAKSVTGFRGRSVEAVPIDRVVEICRRYGVIRKRGD